MYSPNGTRWTFSNLDTMVPSGPQATTSFRKVVDDTVSVTPTTKVVWRLTASLLREFLAEEPSSGEESETTSSGHRTSWGVWPWSSCCMRAVAVFWAASTRVGSTWDFRNPRTPPPCTAAVVIVPRLDPPSGAWSATMVRRTTPLSATDPTKISVLVPPDRLGWAVAG